MLKIKDNVDSLGQWGMNQSVSSMCGDAGELRGAAMLYDLILQNRRYRENIRDWTFRGGHVEPKDWDRMGRDGFVYDLIRENKVFSGAVLDAFFELERCSLVWEDRLIFRLSQFAERDWLEALNLTPVDGPGIQIEKVSLSEVGVRAWRAGIQGFVLAMDDAYLTACTLARWGALPPNAGVPVMYYEEPFASALLSLKVVPENQRLRVMGGLSGVRLNARSQVIASTPVNLVEVWYGW